MQHFDIASIRATVIPSHSPLAIDLTVGAYCRGLTGADVDLFADGPIEALPIADFRIEAEATLTRGEQHRARKATTKARQLDRRQARASKRAASYIA